MLTRYMHTRVGGRMGDSLKYNAGHTFRAGDLGLGDFLRLLSA